MDFLDAVRLLWRRRLVVLLGILLTGAGCAVVLTQVQTVYQASGQYLLLLPATATGKENPQNPLINQPAGLIIAAGLVAGEINTPDTVRELDEEGFASDFSLGLSPDSGALLSVEVTDVDPVAAVAMRDELLQRLDRELSRIQTQEIEGIPRNQIIHSLKSSVNEQAEAVPGAKIRALVMVVAIGGVVTLLLAFGLDKPLTRRSERRREKRAQSDHQDTDRDAGQQEAPAEASGPDEPTRGGGGRRARPASGNAEPAPAPATTPSDTARGGTARGGTAPGGTAPSDTDQGGGPRAESAGGRRR